MSPGVEDPQIMQQQEGAYHMWFIQSHAHVHHAWIDISCGTFI